MLNMPEIYDLTAKVVDLLIVNGSSEEEAQQTVIDELANLIEILGDEE